MHFRKILLVLMLCASQSIYAFDLSGHVDVSYTEANPDFSPFSNGEGVTVYGRLTVEQLFFIYGRHGNAAFKPSGPVSGAEVEGWSEAGAGLRYPLSESWSIEGMLNRQRVSRSDQSHSGHGYKAGVAWQAMAPLGFRLYVGNVDILIEDTTLAFEVDYSILDNIYLIARLRDYADWDFTFYELGLGLRF